MGTGSNVTFVWTFTSTVSIFLVPTPLSLWVSSNALKVVMLINMWTISFSNFSSGSGENEEEKDVDSKIRGVCSS